MSSEAFSSITIGDFTNRQVEEILSLYDQGWSIVRLAKKYGVPKGSMRRTLVARGRRIRFCNEVVERQQPANEPEEDAHIELAPEIAEAAERIREGWTKRQEKKRAVVFKTTPWMPPIADTSHIRNGVKVPST